MVVVVMLGGGAILALHSYNKMKRTNPVRLEETLFSVKQAAGVVGAFCVAIFGVISALESARMIGGSYGGSSDRETVVFGKRASERVAA